MYDLMCLCCGAVLSADEAITMAIGIGIITASIWAPMFVPSAKQMNATS